MTNGDPASAEQVPDIVSADAPHGRTEAEASAIHFLATNSPAGLTVEDSDQGNLSRLSHLAAGDGKNISADDDTSSSDDGLGLFDHAKVDPPTPKKKQLVSSVGTSIHEAVG